MHIQMTVCVHEQTFPAKKCSPLEDPKVHVIAALFINYFHQLALFISSKRSDQDYFGEKELCS